MSWTIRSTLEWTEGHLAAKGAANPRLEAQWLLCAATGLERIELYTNYDLPLDSAQLATLRDGITRRVAGEPLQYILGKAPFRRLEVVVRPPVLIPRPETETLVDLTLAAFAERDDDCPLHILELGTGTGCVALSLAQELAGLQERAGAQVAVQIVATDIDPVAVALARENAESLGLAGERLLIFEDDLATSLLVEDTYQAGFDAIVSNPPYIPTGELAILPNEITQYESRLALDGGTDGLDVFRRILVQAQSLLKPGGLLACELHEGALGAAVTLSEAMGFQEVRIQNDLTNRPRFILMRAARKDVL